MSLAIEFQQVSKQFVIEHEQRKTHGASLWGRLRRRGEWKERFWALRDVSFAIAPGEAVALIGANGSGKSTSLKLMSCIISPTSGVVVVNRQVTGLLELGAGFHPDLSGRDNVYLNGSILGLSRREINQAFDAIVAFAEIERFIDAPVKHYSLGMYMRLGFSIAVHMQPDVLLIDETFAVGDQAFQAKCLTRIHQLKKQGVTIVLVSHSLDAVRELCERGIWLDGGQVRADGRINGVIESYLAEVIRKERDVATPVGFRKGSREIEITAVEFLDGQKRPSQAFRTGEPFIARLHYRAHERITDPVFGVAIFRADGVHVNGPNTDFAGLEIEVVHGEGVVEYVVPSLPLLNGNYFFSAAVYDRQGTYAYDHHHMRYSFSVLPGGVAERYGLLYIPSRWEHRNGKTPLGHLQQAQEEAHS